MIEGFIQGLQGAAAGAVQPLHLLPARARHRRRHGRTSRRAWRSSRAPIRCSATTRTRGQDARPSASTSRAIRRSAEDWPTYTLEYLDGRPRARTMELPLTFADFAMTEARFRKHFRIAPPDTWNENMVPLAEFLALEADEREGKYPVHLDGRPQASSSARLLVDATMVAVVRGPARFLDPCCAPWRGVGKRRRSPRARSRPRSRARSWRGRIGAACCAWRAIRAASPRSAPAGVARRGRRHGTRRRAPARRRRGYMAPWLDTEQCTACDECTRHQRRRSSPTTPTRRRTSRTRPAAPTSDLVKAAEKCTARVIHPGLPPTAARRISPSGSRAVRSTTERSANHALSLLGLSDAFAHGVHPPEAKDDTTRHADPAVPVRAAAVVPLLQHAGKPSLPVVREGQEVVRGAAHRRARRLPVGRHARAGLGRDRAASRWRRGISGRMVPAIYLEPLPGSTQEVDRGARPATLDAASREEILPRSRRPASSAWAARRFRPTSSCKPPPEASRSTR